ncbi:unnamed protein product [Phytomonas sp. EM1]|nr:unnamed protein product [Phytomonas sp. EM1]|eukprot:CCW61283.1 unnamed protein product [Phytomonas sp. isolate EM1]
MSFRGYALLLVLVSFTMALATDVPLQSTGHALLVSRIPERKTALYVTPYRDGILRLTIKPEKEWSFTVPHSVVAEPEAFETPGLNCTPHDATCVVEHQNCTMVIRLSQGASEVIVNYTCVGLPLVSATVDLQQTPRAVVTSTFPSAQTMYGLAEHAADLPLRSGSPYELFNHDAFQYPLNSTNALYGAIPFLMAYSAKATTGFLFLNAAELHVVVRERKAPPEEAPPRCEWRAEVGPVDFFLLPGPTPAQVQRQHAFLTGPTVFPPYFALGYHQSRRSYLDFKDALSVDEGFDQHHMPYDALWLDVEHTDEGRSFTWDERAFPDAEVLSDALESKGRRLITFISPEVRRVENFTLHEEAEQGHHAIQDAKGEVFKGEGWVGECSWPDFLNARTRAWYAGFFQDRESPGKGRSRTHVGVGMNEPAVRNAPRRTMGKELIHYDDHGHRVEHRSLHNMYGLLSVISAYQGALGAAGEGKAVKTRPFLLTRSFFAGSQRYAAMWTGDNVARWDHLQSTPAELLSLSISNYPFCGSDVGGFYSEPEEELFVRWMQMGIFYPFFRGNANHDTRRREPWAFSEEAQHHVRYALALRYALLPYLYTVFYRAHRHGETVLRPLFFEFPAQEDLWGEQTTFMFGPSLLVSPVVHRKATETTVRLPAREIWYEYSTGEAITGRTTYPMPVTLQTIPLFLRGGHIVPLKLRLRRSTYAARGDPFTLYIALNAKGESRGEFYLDDGTTFHYERGDSLYRRFEFSKYHLRCTKHPEASTNSTFTVSNVVERIVVMGYNRKPLKIYRVSTTEEGPDPQIAGEPMRFERVGNSIIVHNPRLKIEEDWEIRFEND